MARLTASREPSESVLKRRLPNTFLVPLSLRSLLPMPVPMNHGTGVRKVLTYNILKAGLMWLSVMSDVSDLPDLQSFSLLFVLQCYNYRSYQTVCRKMTAVRREFQFTGTCKSLGKCTILFDTFNTWFNKVYSTYALNTVFFFFFLSRKKSSLSV